jgi:hypothetical protein
MICNVGPPSYTGDRARLCCTRQSSFPWSTTVQSHFTLQDTAHPRVSLGKGPPSVGSEPDHVSCYGMVQILYSEASKEFVMLFHLDTPSFELTSVGVAKAGVPFFS